MNPEGPAVSLNSLPESVVTFNDDTTPKYDDVGNNNNTNNSVNNDIKSASIVDDNSIAPKQQQQQIDEETINNDNIREEHEHESTTNIKRKQHQDQQQHQLPEQQQQQQQQQGGGHKKRKTCINCFRPLCICISLPTKRINLQYCYIIILQHPLEYKNNKNSSVSIIPYCFTSTSYTIIINRRFGNTSTNNNIDNNNSSTQLSEIISNKMNTIQNQQQNQHVTITPIVWLLYPSSDATVLGTALDEVLSTTGASNDNDDNTSSTNTNNNTTKPIQPFIFLLFLDATWKYSKEMDAANILHNQYPTHMKRIQLDTSTFTNCINYIPRRFEIIRTPISDNHLSTTECIAHVTNTTEVSVSKKLLQVQQQQQEEQSNNDVHKEIDRQKEQPDGDEESIYNILMKPLDLIVQQSKSFLQGDRKKIRQSQAIP